jgi:hypothetical protein
MKLAFVVYSERCASRMMQLLKAAKIDYYTQWKEVEGAGHGTQPHLGGVRALGGFGATNCVLMVAFDQESFLAELTRGIKQANAEIDRPDDKIRMFVLPLESIV